MSTPLGRGLSSLIPSAPAPRLDTGDRVQMISVDDIVPNPYQPRKTFRQEEIAELAASIREHGVLSPLIVTKEGHGYALIAGERRLRASKAAGLSEVPCIVRQANDEQRLVQAIIENVQRSDLNAVDEALAYQQLMDEHGLTQELVAKRVGKPRATVANVLRVLGLPESMRDALRDGRLTFGHAKILLALQPVERERLFQRIMSSGLSVRALETEVRGQEKSPKSSTQQLIPDIKNAEADLRSFLGAKVEIRNEKIVIPFVSTADLKMLVRRIIKR